MTRLGLLGMLALGTLAAACGSPPRDPAPVTIAYGRDECAYCRMPIDEPRLAAEFVERGGAAHKFGEPGCLVSWMRKGARAEGTAFVTDAARGGWLPAAAATYVAGRVRTAMSYDVAAYATAPAGVAVGTMRDWHTLLEQGVSSAPR